MRHKDIMSPQMIESKPKLASWFTVISRNFVDVDNPITTKSQLDTSSLH